VPFSGAPLAVRPLQRVVGRRVSEIASCSSLPDEILEEIGLHHWRPLAVFGLDTLFRVNEVPVGKPTRQFRRTGRAQDDEEREELDIMPVCRLPTLDTIRLIYGHRFAA
jgi:hypothetical protein